MKGRVLYSEVTRWAWWVHGLLWLPILVAMFPIQSLMRGSFGEGTGGVLVGTTGVVLLICLSIPAGIYGLMGELRIRVTDDGLDLRWGYLEWIRKKIPIGEVEGAEAVKYSPLRDFGGWGIRMGRGGRRAWTVKGNRAVLLHLSGGTEFYLGSDRPELLLQWVEAARKGNRK
jgi:hypothetical protein